MVQPGRAVHFTDNSTAWEILATDGTGYTTEALLEADSKTAWPGSAGSGEFPRRVGLSCENASGAAGDDFYYLFNGGAAFSDLANDGLRDNLGTLVRTGDSVPIAGVDHESSFMIHNIWIRKITGGDEVVVTAE